MARKIPPRLFSFLIAVALHILLLVFAVFTIRTIAGVSEPRSDIMKLADIREEIPAPREQIRPPRVSDESAENLVESDELEFLDAGENSGEFIDFLPMHSVSELPRFPEAEIRSRMVYPPIAQRAGLEGTVYLELFVDNQGLVRNISILKEDPADRGFGEAAVRIFQGMRGEPAKVNGRNVALRYRYPVRFSLTD
jgi:protein TonB